MTLALEDLVILLPYSRMGFRLFSHTCCVYVCGFGPKKITICTPPRNLPNRRAYSVSVEENTDKIDFLRLPGLLIYKLF